MKAATGHRFLEIFVGDAKMNEDASDPTEKSDAVHLHELQAGDEQAADAIFQRYFSRLRGLVKSHLSARLASRVDPEDVVMSAYRSFFRTARDGRYSLQEGIDLWRLLMEITLHKLYRQHTKHFAQRRSRSRESGDAADWSHDRSPSPDVAVAATEELAAIFSALPAHTRQVLELRLQGFQIKEIADQVSKSERTVRRWLDDCKREMTARFPQLAQSIVKRAPVEKPIRTQAKLSSDSLVAFSDFKLEQQIGTGSSGKVYRARHLRSGETVAIKYLRKRLANDRNEVKRFVQEWRIIEGLNQPGIMRTHGIGRTPSRGYFIVMDFLVRGDLQKVIERGPVDVKLALRWISEAASAIAFARQRGIIHRDLKPSNLLVADDGRIVVTDFGLATNLKLDRTDGIAGTPAYLAPEQINPIWGEVGPATDVNGLGAVFYALITRQTPRQGTFEQVCDKAAAGKDIALPERFPAALREICRRCLSPRWQDRYSSAQELVEAVNQIALTKDS